MPEVFSCELTSEVGSAMDWVLENSPAASIAEFDESTGLPARPGAVHTWIFFLSVVAFVFYFLGSKGFYHGTPKSILWLGIGILADTAMAVGASLRILPVLLPGETIPYRSILFVIHMSGAGIGMIGFILLFAYVLIRGQRRDYPIAKKIAYWGLFPLWALGAVIGFANFFAKFFFGVNLYRHL